MIKRLLRLGVRPRPHTDAVADRMPQSGCRRQAGVALTPRRAREFAAVAN